MTKRIQEIIARLRRPSIEPQANGVQAPDAFDRLARMAAAEARRPVRLTPLAAR